MNNIKEITAAVISIIIVLAFCGSIFFRPETLEITTPLLTGVIGFYLRPISTFAAAKLRKN